MPSGTILDLLTHLQTNFFLVSLKKGASLAPICMSLKNFWFLKEKLTLKKKGGSLSRHLKNTVFESWRRNSHIASVIKDKSNLKPQDGFCVKNLRPTKVWGDLRQKPETGARQECQTSYRRRESVGKGSLRWSLSIALKLARVLWK